MSTSAKYSCLTVKRGLGSLFWDGARAAFVCQWGFVRSVPALLDLGAGRRRRFPARSIWTAAMLSLGVLHTFHYELHKKAGMFFLILMYPRPRRAKNGVFSTACPRRCRCGWVTLRRLTSFWAPVRREAPLFVLTEFACRLKSPVEGVLGINMVCPARMQPSWLAEYSQKCTVLPRGPVHAAKTIPAFLFALPFCCTDFFGCRAR